MNVDFLYPEGRGRVQPSVQLQSGMVFYANRVNWNPLLTGKAGWVMWNGTAFVEFGPASLLVYSNTIVAPVTSLTLTGLTGTLDGGYEFEFYLPNVSGGVCGWNIFFNNDQTPGNYRRQLNYFAYGGAAMITGSAADANLDTVSNNTYSILTGRIINAPWQQASYDVARIDGVGTPNFLSGRSVITRWNFQPAGITRIDIVATIANGIQAGAYLRLWRKASR